MMTMSANKKNHYQRYLCISSAIYMALRNSLRYQNPKKLKILRYRAIYSFVINRLILQLIVDLGCVPFDVPFARNAYKII